MNPNFIKIGWLLAAAWALADGGVFAQNPDWPIVPNRHHFTSGGSTPSAMPGSYPTPYFASNCAQDDAGNLMFYVVNDKIYDNGGVFIGSCTNLSYSNNGKDILIIPDPNDCKARLILSAYVDLIVGPSSGYYCWFLQVTRVSKSGSTWIVQPNVYSDNFCGNDNFFMSMTVSRPNTSGQRIWYVVTSKGVTQYVINSSGISYNGNILFGYIAAPADAEVSPTGDRLAWTDASNTYEIRWVTLGANGSFQILGHIPLHNIGSYKPYGLEFIDNTNVLVAAVRTSTNGPQSGIFKKDLNVWAATPLLANAAYAESQLEKALDGKIYAASATGLWGIDPVSNVTTTIPGTVQSNHFGSLTSPTTYYYSLPKQLDYENYPVVFGCPCPQNVTITGVYSTPVTESQTWIKSTGACAIAASSTVKLDADPVNGYVLLDAGFSASAAQNVVFVAQAFNGCTPGAPQRPPADERTDDSISEPEVQRNAHGASLFPNPTTDDFTLAFAEALASETVVTVMDLTGRTVLKAVIPAGETRRVFSLGLQPAGIYAVQARSDGKPVWEGKVVLKVKM